jgi:hypothetical protein
MFAWLKSWFVKSASVAVPKSCRYCGVGAAYKLSWRRGALGKPGPVVVAYCGRCSVGDALAKRGMTAPVVEGEDYTVEPITPGGVTR